MPFSKFNAVFSRIIAHLFGPLSAGFADALRVGADTFPKPARPGMAYLFTLLQGHWRSIRSSMCIRRSARQEALAPLQRPSRSHARF
jgi:hypothetical protein